MPVVEELEDQSTAVVQRHPLEAIYQREYQSLVRLASILVDDRTDRGIRIGSTQAAVLDAYSGAEVRNAEEQRHWVLARSGEDTVVFEIENQAVVAFRTGLRQVVEADEICP